MPLESELFNAFELKIYLEAFLTSADGIISASDAVYFLALKTVPTILARTIVPLTSPAIVVLFAFAPEKGILFCQNTSISIAAVRSILVTRRVSVANTNSVDRTQRVAFTEATSFLAVV